MQKKNVSGRDERVGGKVEDSVELKKWNDFKEHLKNNGFDEEVIVLTISVYDLCVKASGSQKNLIVYTKNNVISFHTPPNTRGKDKVFAYIEVYKEKVRLFLTYDGNELPAGSIKNPNKNHECIFIFVTPNAYMKLIKKPTETSYKLSKR